MARTLDRVKGLVAHTEVRFSLHGLEELEADAITARDIIAGVDKAIEIEDYPHYWKGPAVLVLQHDIMGKVIHVVWGIERDADGPATVVTAYRPDPLRWSDDNLRRR